MASSSPSSRANGVFAALGCYLIWGLVPLFWKQLANIDSVELTAHRHVWSLAVVAIWLLVRGSLGELRGPLGSWRAIGWNFSSGLLLTANWLIYVIGVNTGHVVEASLGYFLAPLVNVASARFVLHERMRPAQAVAIGCATVGVIWLVAQIGRAPWIALGLAVSWGGYSLMRKKSPLGAVTGLTVETLLLAPLALGYLGWQHHLGRGALGHVGPMQTALVLSSGVLTAAPLVLFAYAARRIRLSTLGLLQYLTPTVQFSLGVWIYGEAFPRERFGPFSFIWAALILYACDGAWSQRTPAPVRSAA